MQSFLDRGHQVRLYSYHSLDPPPGVEEADAGRILSADDLPRYHTIAAFADAFRYELLSKEGGWWVDVDVVCLTDKMPQANYAWAEQEPGVVNVAILKFPKGDAILAQLATLARASSGDTAWGVTGPHLISKVLRGFDPPDRAGTTRQFYPLHWLEAPLLLLPEYKLEVLRRTKDAMFLHLWAHALHEVGIDRDADVPRGSLLYDLLKPGADNRATLWTELKMRRAINKYWRQSWVRDHWSNAFDRTKTPPRVRYRLF